MNVIFITRESYSLAGARVRCYNIARGLCGCGIDADVLSFADTLGAFSGADESKLTLFQKLKYNYHAFRTLWAAGKKTILVIHRVHYHSFAPLLVHMVRGNPLVLDMDDWEMRENTHYYFGWLPSSKAEWLLRFITRRSVFCVAASRFFFEYLKRFRSQVSYVPSVIDEQFFKPPSFRDEMKNGAVVAWVGTMNRKTDVTNISFALSCFNEIYHDHPNTCFEIVGDGIYLPQLRELIRREYSSIEINIRGWIDPDEIFSYLSTIDIGVFPLVGETKFHRSKCPVKLFEYMAMGKAVIASNIGEAAHIIQHKVDGFLASNHEEFIAALDMLISQPDRRKEIGINARRKICAVYSYQKVVEQWKDLLGGVFAF